MIGVFDLHYIHNTHTYILSFHMQMQYLVKYVTIKEKVLPKKKLYIND